MPSNVVTLSSQDIQRKRLQREGRSVFVEFFCAPGCDIADASVEDWPEDLTFMDMATWLRSFAYELQELAKEASTPEEYHEKDTATDEPQ